MDRNAHAPDPIVWLSTWSPCREPSQCGNTIGNSIAPTIGTRYVVCETALNDDRWGALSRICFSSCGAPPPPPGTTPFQRCWILLPVFHGLSASPTRKGGVGAWLCHPHGRLGVSFVAVFKRDFMIVLGETKEFGPLCSPGLYFTHPPSQNFCGLPTSLLC